MRRLLLLGGMTPDVTVLYYTTINQCVRSKLGGRNGAPLYLYSANLEDMIQHMTSGRWDLFRKTYLDPIRALVAHQQIDGVIVCAILAHKVARQLRNELSPTGVPLLHIADYLAFRLREEHPRVKKLGLLGPKVTMMDAEDPDFFVGALQKFRDQFTIMIPDTPESIEEVNRGMIEEVAKGPASVTQATREMFVSQARDLIRRGAQAIILGSTDLGFIIKQEDIGQEVPVIEPALVHAQGAAEWILEDG